MLSFVFISLQTHTLTHVVARTGTHAYLRNRLEQVQISSNVTKLSYKNLDLLQLRTIIVRYQSGIIPPKIINNESLTAPNLI